MYTKFNSDIYRCLPFQTIDFWKLGKQLLAAFVEHMFKITNCTLSLQIS